MSPRLRLPVLAVGIALFGCLNATAQTYPNKPIR